MEQLNSLTNQISALTRLVSTVDGWKLVDCYVDIEGGELVTIFNTFGKQPNSYNYVLLSINQTSTYPGLEFVFDVTDQFDNPDNTNHVIIVSDEIDVPDPGSGGGGLDPEVSDWDEEHKNVDI